MDANGWSIVIGAIFLGLTQIIGMFLSYLREQRIVKHVEEVRLTLAQGNALNNHKIDSVVDRMDKLAKISRTSDLVLPRV